MSQISLKHTYVMLQLFHLNVILAYLCAIQWHSFNFRITQHQREFPYHILLLRCFMLPVQFSFWFCLEGRKPQVFGQLPELPPTVCSQAFPPGESSVCSSLLKYFSILALSLRKALIKSSSQERQRRRHTYSLQNYPGKKNIGGRKLRLTDI